MLYQKSSAFFKKKTPKETYYFKIQNVKEKVSLKNCIWVEQIESLKVKLTYFQVVDLPVNIHKKMPKKSPQK